jgi:hypothetical protein
MNAQINNNDSLALHKKYRYWNLTLITGANVSFHQKTSGQINVSFPYKFIKDGAHRTDSFSSQKQDLRFTTRCYFLPVALEMGNDKVFFNYSIAFSSLGLNMSTGFGFIAFPNRKNLTNKSSILKCSINAYYETGCLSSILGTINNAGSTVYVFGLTEDSTFTISGGKNSRPKVYNAQNLNVYYRQNALSIMPKISIGNNPFKGGRLVETKPNSNGISKRKFTWEFAVGYNIDICSYEGISFVQNDGNGHKNAKSKIIGLKTDDLAVLYNGKKLTSTPYNISGLYLSFTIGIAGTN